MLPFKCKYCPRMFATARGRTVHETKVHKDLRRVRQNKKQKEHRHLAPAGPLVSVSSSLSLDPLLRSAYFETSTCSCSNRPALRRMHTSVLKVEVRFEACVK
jgi:hypothetical protein